MQKKFYLIFLFIAVAQIAFAGNPDRQGEAGAAQLLLNPYARSAGLHTMNTSTISGVEALRLNVAGLVRIAGNTQIMVSHARYFDGTQINMNAIGLAQRIGKNGSFGVSIMAMDVGDIRVTTEDRPEGTGATFSPSLFNLGISYAHLFENKVSVGITARIVSEGTSNVTATGVALDAGVQYVTGENDAFKFGISLRNVGSPMTFSGDGLSQQATNPDPQTDYDLTYLVKSAKFEMPSVLNIGASYDLYFGTQNKVTLLGNFTSNTFSEDFLGAGFEYAFNNMFMLRGAYRYEFDTNEEALKSVYSGLSAGASVQVPYGEDKKNSFGIDYAYRHTNIWSGTHNISIRIDI